jgi:DNA polymerase III subunit alpha
VQQSLAFEKEALGFYISGHPLDKFDRVIKKISTGTISDIKEKPSAGDVKIGGVVSALKLKNTKKGERYAGFHLEDKSGFIDVIAWPDVYRKSVELLASDEPILVNGRLEASDERIQVFANEITSLAQATSKVRSHKNTQQNGQSDRVHLYVNEAEVSNDELIRLRETFLDYPGPCTVCLHFRSLTRNETIVELPDHVRVASSPELAETVKRVFGMRVGFQLSES